MSESSISSEDDDSPAALPGNEPQVLPAEEIGPEEEADLSEQYPSEDAAALDHESYVDSQSGLGASEDDGTVVFDVEPVDVEPVTTTLDVRPPEAPAEEAEVTLYDVDEPGDPVGRLVESSPESDAEAFDSGEVEGLTAEESAMHTTDEP